MSIDISKINNILIAQSDFSTTNPYLFLEQKYNLKLHFIPFLQIEPISTKEFRKQNIDFSQFSAVYFAAKIGVDAFFQMCEKEKVVLQKIKYFCISESVALYIQKYTIFRKRRIFYSPNGKFNHQEFQEQILKHNDERFLLVLSEQNYTEPQSFFQKNKINFEKGIFYKTVNCDLRESLNIDDYQMFVFFTPQAVRSLYESFPNFTQQDKIIAVYGKNTLQTAQELGLKVDIQSPTDENPAMYNALDNFFVKK